MASLVVDVATLNLPAAVTGNLKGRKGEVLETPEGVLVRPVSGAIERVRGMLRGTNCSTEKFLETKAEEKKLEEKNWEDNHVRQLS